MMTENARQLQERRQHLASLQLMFTVSLALGMLLVFQFAKRITDAQPLNAEFAQTNAEVLALQQERARLEEELTFIQSDAYVEIWARSEAKMLRPGETLVITLGSNQGEELPAGNTASPDTVENAFVGFPVMGGISGNGQLWWELFFDAPLPGQY